MSAPVADPAQVLEAYRAAVRTIIKERAAWEWCDASMRASGHTGLRSVSRGADAAFEIAEEALAKADPAFFAAAKATQKPIPVAELGDVEPGVNAA